MTNYVMVDGSGRQMHLADTVARTDGVSSVLPDKSAAASVTEWTYWDAEKP
jgi:hypothetical protein